jgi:ADP-ribose diphosphatase
VSEAPPAHPDLEIVEAATSFKRFLRIDTFRFRHRLFSGAWSAERHYDVLRRGAAVAMLLYDPVRDELVLIEQFRLPALLGGCSPWQLEAVAGLVDRDEAPAAVAVRETREEAGIALAGEPVFVQRYLPSCGDSDESVALYCACVDAAAAGGVHGLPEEHEDIRVVVKTVAEVEALLDTGVIDNGHTLVLLYWFLRHREQLRREWLSAPRIP